MTRNEPPVFGENGTILNAEKMRPQSAWPKPAPQGLTRKQWIKFMITLLLVIGVTTATMMFTIIP